MSHPAEHVSVRARAIASPGLLAKLAAVLNPHPVASFDFAASPDGTATVVVSLSMDELGRADWHLTRVIARLSRVVGVMSVETGPGGSQSADLPASGARDGSYGRVAAGDGATDR